MLSFEESAEKWPFSAGRGDHFDPLGYGPVTSIHDRLHSASSMFTFLTKHLSAIVAFHMATV